MARSVATLPSRWLLAASLLIVLLAIGIAAGATYPRWLPQALSVAGISPPG